MSNCGDCPRWEKAITPPALPHTTWRVCPAANQPAVWSTSPECPLAAAERRVKLLTEALRAVEWVAQVGWDEYHVWCDVCTRSADDGHAPDCIVGRALANQNEEAVK